MLDMKHFGYNWAPSWENLFMQYANNKGADQPAHPRSLISAFVVSCLDSIIPLVSIAEISSLYLASVAAQAGLSLPWSQTWKTGFLVTRLNWYYTIQEANNEETDQNVQMCRLICPFFVWQVCQSKAQSLSKTKPDSRTVTVYTIDGAFVRPEELRIEPATLVLQRKYLQNCSINRRSYMSAHVFLNLLKRRGKR